MESRSEAAALQRLDTLSAIRSLSRIPIASYYGGRGDKVAAEMKRRYGKDWKRVFYATANRRGLKPGAAENKKAALKAMADDRKRRRSR